MNETRIQLHKKIHLAQLLGVTDKNYNYILGEEVAHLLRNLNKVEITDPNKLDIGNQYICLESQALFEGKPLFFRVEMQSGKHGKQAMLFLQEEAEEIGGMVAYTYLTPLAVFEAVNLESLNTELYEQFQIDINGTDNESHLAKLDSYIKKRNEKRRIVEQEAERLSRGAATRINRILSTKSQTNPLIANVKKEFEETKQAAKRFTRPGKPDYHQSQVRMVNQIIDNKDLRENGELRPIVDTIEKNKQKVETVLQKVLEEELSATTKPATIEHRTVKPQEAHIKPSNRKAAIINKLPMLERTAIENSRLNFGELFSRVKGNKTKRTHPMEFTKDVAERRAKFKAEYEKKGTDILKILNSTDEISETEVDKVAVQDKNETQAATIPTEMSQMEQIEQIVSAGLAGYEYKTESKKTALTITKKAIIERINEQENMK